jgi:hypothetical protein
MFGGSAGVPLVVVPVFADQFENGHRVARTGSRARRRVEQPRSAGSREVIAEADAPRVAQAIPKCWPPRRIANGPRRHRAARDGAPPSTKCCDAPDQLEP